MNRKTVLALVGAATLAVPASARANNLFTLDPTPSGPGRVIQDGAGTAYVAWLHADAANNDHAMFCKIPRGGTCPAPIELPAPDGTFSPSGAHPVFGAAGVVDVVVPSYPNNELAVYKSTNGGASFGAPAVLAYASAQTNPSSVVRNAAGQFFMSGDNPDLGFHTFTESTGSSGFAFASPSSPDLDGSSLALDAAGKPVEAFWTNPGDSPYQVGFYRYNGSGSITSPANWSGPVTVSSGYESKLAGGASGVFMVSQDYAGGGNPSAVNVRKYDGASFGAPVTLANDAGIDLFAGGAIAQSPSGRVDVAWPGPRGGDNAFVMRVYSSTNGGASYSAETDVARLPQDYGVNDNAQLAVADDGSGWLTFSSVTGGLQVADLTPVAPYVPPGGGGGGGGTAPPAYTGPNRTVTGSVGRGLSVTLKLPKGCLAARQQFKVFVGTKIKHKLAHGRHLAVKKVVFGVDGHTVKTLKRGPFTLRTALSGASRSRHTITARVTVRIRHGHHTKTVTKTIRGTLTLC